MQLDKVTAEIRPRTSYEAIDLGMAMARATGWRMWAAWFAATLPVFLLCNFVAYRLGYMWLGALFVWWLKPLFDRVPLFVLSQGLFGDEVGVRGTLKALPGLWLRALPTALLLERLDLARSLDLPVAQLEGLGIFARGKRQRMLQRNTRGPGVLLSVMCLGLELALYMSAWVLVLMFVPFDYLPESYRALWAAFMTHATPLHQFINNGVWYLAISVMEPLYVGAGFALYLNRRTELEAWDLEIALRRMAERISADAKAASILLAALSFACFCLMAPGPARAEDAPAASTAPPAASVSHVVVAVWPRPAGLAEGAEQRFAANAGKAYDQDSDLSPHERHGYWQYKESTDPKSTPLPAWLEKVLKWFTTLRDYLGTAVSFIPWLIGLVLLGLAVRYRRWLLSLFTGLGAGTVGGRYEARLEVLADAEALPKDVVVAARRAWDEGDARGALSLLYRGGVARMQEFSGSELPQGATEADCLREAGKLPGTAADTLRRVVRTWQYAAYAHRLPDPAAFSDLLDAWRVDLEVKT